MPEQPNLNVHFYKGLCLRVRLSPPELSIEQATGAFVTGVVLLAPELPFCSLRCAIHRLDCTPSGMGLRELCLICALERRRQQHLERFDTVQEVLNGGFLRQTESVSACRRKDKMNASCDHPALAGCQKYCGLRRSIR